MSGSTLALESAAVVDDGWSEELAAVHRGLSAEDLRFRELARTHPEMLDRARFAALDANKHLLRFRIQPWPTFIGRAKLDEFKRISGGICRLIRQIPERIFRNDPVRVAEFYEIGSPALTEIFLSQPTGADTLISRGDFIDTRNGFQCIEFNFTPNLGGWETSILAGMHMEVPGTAEIVRSVGIRFSYTNTMRKFFFHLVDDGTAKGICAGDELNIVVVISRESTADQIEAVRNYLNHEYDLAKEDLGGRIRGRVDVCSHGSLIAVRDALYLEKRRIHAVVEFSEDLTPTGVYRCFKANRLTLCNGPISPMLTSKKNIVLLSEHASSPVFDPAEQELLLRHIPWSRRVLPGPVSIHGEQVDLAELLASQREDLVLKDADSCGGKDVFVGRFTPAGTWEEAVRRALEKTGWVVQEHVESLPYLYQSGERGCSPHDVIWGPFYFGDTYGGAILRMQPKAERGPVNLSLNATEGIVFEVQS